MIRISNRNYDSQSIAGPQIQYVERIVEVPVEHIVVAKAPDAIIQYIDREIIREIPVAGETIVMSQPVDLKVFEEKQEALDSRVQGLSLHYHQWFGQIGAELEMQRRALVAIKMQRDVDRSRRLMLIKRMKKESKDHQKQVSFLKFSVGLSLLVAVLTLIIKL